MHTYLKQFLNENKAAAGEEKEEEEEKMKNNIYAKKLFITKNSKRIKKITINKKN